MDSQGWFFCLDITKSGAILVYTEDAEGKPLILQNVKDALIKVASYTPVRSDTDRARMAAQYHKPVDQISRGGNYLAPHRVWEGIYPPCRCRFVIDRHLVPVYTDDRYS